MCTEWEKLRELKNYELTKSQCKNWKQSRDNSTAVEVENDTSNDIRILGNLYPRQSVDLMERNTWMDQNNETVAQLVSTIDTEHVKSKDQDRDGIPDYQKPLILLNLSGIETSTNAQICASRVESLVRKRGA